MADKIIVFHPGHTLRFGLASSENPQSTFQMIARKKRNPRLANQEIGINQYPKHPILPVIGKQQPEVVSARLQLRCLLQNNKKDRQPQLDRSPEEICEFNKTAKRESIGLTGSIRPWACHDQEDFVVGDSVLQINPTAEFDIYCPWKRGTLNLNSGLGGSVSSVLGNLETIWKWCLEHELHIDMSKIKVIFSI